MSGVAAYRFILDTSALRDYARGDQPAVGELVREAHDEYTMIGVPAMCLSAALAEIPRGDDGAGKRGLLRLLSLLPNVTLLPFTVDGFESARHFAEDYLVELGSRVDVACAAREAIEFAAEQTVVDGDVDVVFVLTTEPEAYDGLGGNAPPTVDLAQGW